MSLNFLKNNPLFQECLEALNTCLLPKEESDKLSKLFKQIVPITTWGKVNWEKIDHHVFIGYDPIEIIPALEKLLQQPVDKMVFIEWSDYELPVIKANLDAIVKFFDDVACVAHEKFIFNLTQGYIIEVRIGHAITVGLLPPMSKEQFEQAMA